MEKNQIYSERIFVNGRTYFFDLKQASNGKNYLTLTESKKNKEGEYENNRIMLFSGEDIPKFKDTFSRVIEKLAKKE